MNYLSSPEGCETLMACFAVLSVLATLATKLAEMGFFKR